MKPSDYKHIEAWHAASGSWPYYWKNLQEQAAQENAPVDATFRDSSGRWHTITECQNLQMLDRINTYLKGL